jgi:hypothetical protein
MKKNKTLLKELRQELHDNQMMTRVDIRAVKAGMEKSKRIAARMRKLQREENK